jgi:hypothetical protein
VSKLFSAGLAKEPSLASLTYIFGNHVRRKNVDLFYPVRLSVTVRFELAEVSELGSAIR